MGLCSSSPDIFQEKMNVLLDGLDTVRVYIDDILHITKGSWELSGEKCYCPIWTLMLRSKYTLMHAKHKLVLSYDPKTEH